MEISAALWWASADLKGLYFLHTCNDRTQKLFVTKIFS